MVKFLLIGAAIVAIVIAWRVYAKQLRHVIGTVVRYGLILGGIGFVAGCFGPMIFNPGAHHGPLLGLFITGPIGLLLGFLLGAFIGFKRATRAPKTNPRGPGEPGAQS